VNDRPAGMGDNVTGIGAGGENAQGSLPYRAGQPALLEVTHFSDSSRGWTQQ
jgi:hypothetical protein